MSRKFKFTETERLALERVYGNNNPNCIVDVALKAIELYEARRVKKTNPSKDGFFTWTVELSVDEKWVADGFDLTDDLAHYILCRTLPHAYGHELEAKVLSAPPKNAILKAQGYEVKPKRRKNK